MLSHESVFLETGSSNKIVPMCWHDIFDCKGFSFAFGTTAVKGVPMAVLKSERRVIK